MRSAINIFAMANRQNQHDKTLVLQTAHDAVIPYPVASQPTESPGQGVAHLARIAGCGDPVPQKRPKTLLHRMIELAERVSRPGIEFNRPSQAHAPILPG